MEEADDRQAPGAFVLILGGETKVNQLLAWSDPVLTPNAGMSECMVGRVDGPGDLVAASCLHARPGGMRRSFARTHFPDTALRLG